MGEIRFGLLYGVCLAGCLTLVSTLRAHAEVPAVEAVVQEVEHFLAVPPKPDGASEERGEGEAPLHTWEGCEQRGGDFRDACFKALAWQRAERDVNGALESCDEVRDKDQRFECVADVAELHSLTDLERSEGICPTIPKKKWEDQCWFGIALAWSTEDFEYARASCSNAGMWRDFCRHDVNGEIAQVDAQNALAWCKLEEGDALQRKTCFHGLGKYLGRTEPLAAIELCKEVPTHDPLYQENCFHGLGWAVAEQRSEEETAQFCRELPRHQDSCFLGLSAHAKRLSPDRALEHCQVVEREDLRQRCSAFAKR